MLRRLARALTIRANRTGSIRTLKLAWLVRDLRSWLRGGPSWSELSAARARHFRRNHPPVRVELKWGEGR
jgi:hypothetical protein